MTNPIDKYIFIYTLSSPLEEEKVRYVGKSIIPSKRYNQHIYCANKKGTKNRNSNWIKSLLNQGLKPIMNIIDKVEYECWEHYEKQYIKLYKSVGAKLNNHCDGGMLDNISFKNGMYQKQGNRKGVKVSEETRKRMKETHKNINHKNKGRKIAKLSLDGELLEIYDRISDAEEKTGFSRHGIYRVIYGKTPSNFGFKFKFIV